MLRVDPNDYSAAKRQYTDITRQKQHQAHTPGKDGLKKHNLSTRYSSPNVMPPEINLDLEISGWVQR